MSDVAFPVYASAPATTRSCMHCGDALRAPGDFCCAGCASAHAIIGAAGLGAFYRRLEESRAHRPVPLEADFTSFARETSYGTFALDLLVDGLDCAACVWLIESLLGRNRDILAA